MSMHTRILTDSTEQIELYATNRRGAALTGKTDLYVRVRRQSDGLYLDWNDDTFKASGWTTLNQILTEVDATNSPGLYLVTGGLDTSAITNAGTDDVYVVIPLQTPGTDASLPAPGEIRVGDYVDDIPDILADTSAIDSRLPSDPADESNQLAQHTATQAAITALNDLSQADVQSALTAQGYTVARAGNLDNLDATVSTRSTHSAADVDTVLTGTHGAGSWASDSDTDWSAAEREQIRDALGVAGTKTAATGGQLQDVLTDTAAIDGRLPSDPADESNQLAQHTATQAAIAGLNDLSQADVQTALTAQGYTVARAGNLDNLDTLISSRSGHSAADVDTVLSGTHGAGAWSSDSDTDWSTAEREQIRDALGVDGTKTSATGGQLQDVLTDTAAIDSRLPTDPADESNQLAQHTATQAAIAGLNDLSVVDVQSAMTLQGYTPARASSLDNLDATISSLPTAGGIADAVWDEPQADHLTAGSTGESLDDAGTGAGAPTPSAIADAVWDEDVATHVGAGSMGEAQARLDVDVSTRAVAGDAMDLIAGALDSNALDLTAVAEIADGVWDEDLSGHTTGGSAGQAQNRLDADISSRAAPGAEMDLITGAVDANAVATSGAEEIADAVWDEALAAHTVVGSTGEAQNRLDDDITSRAAAGDAMALTVPAQTGLIDGIWDEALAGHLGAGSTGKALDDAGATADPSAIADAVWDEPITGHTTAGSVGQLQARADVATSTRAAPGDPMDLQSNALDAAAVDTSGAQAIRDEILTDSTPFAGANINAPITTRAAPGDAMDLITDALDAAALATSAVDEIADQVWEEAIADHSGTAGSTAESLDSVAAPAAPAVIAAAVWDEALAGHVAAGSAGEAQNRLDDDITSRTAPGDAMDLITNALDSAAVATSGANEIRDAILSDGTAFPGASIDAAITTRAVAGDAMGITPGASTTIAGDAADAVWDEALAGHAIAGTAGEAQNRLDADISSRAAPGDAMGVSAGGVSAVADGIWDEPLAGHLGAGTTGKALDDAGATADPSAIADAVWDEPRASHTTAGTMGEAQDDAGNIGNEVEKIDSAPTAWPPAAGSLLDRIANKDGSQTYDQSRDSLEGIRDRIG